MIMKGDCIEVMQAMKPNSVDAIVTDPPYGLEFMGKEWDKLGFKASRINAKKEMKRDCNLKPRNKNNPWQKVASGYGSPQKNPRCRKCGKLKYGYYKSNCKCKESDFDYRYSEYGFVQQACHQEWLTEAYRVLKPGGSMLVMGGTRTFHRLACAIEDSGFIIKDTLMWIYGSGFPKCQDITPMIDAKILGITTKQVKERREKEPNPLAKKQTGQDAGKGLVGERNPNLYITQPLTPEAKHWDGFKVGGIKPAYEPIIWAVKPPEGSYVDNVLKWGVGAVNVDECRIEHGGNLTKGGCTKYGGMFGNNGKVNNPDGNSKGRFPANVILSHHPECVQVGVNKVRNNSGSVSGLEPSKPAKNVYGEYGRHTFKKHGDSAGMEQVESWDCHPDCAVRLLDEQSGVLRGSHGTTGTGKGHSSGNIYPRNLGGKVGANYPDTNSSGASRFFYCAKASRGERNAGLNELAERDACHYNQSGRRYGGGNRKNWKDPYKKPQFQNNHPTVKPIKLFEWLIKLVTREGQIILDPFIGSGTTSIAAHNTERKCIGIEKEDEYLEIAKRRIDYWKNQPKQMEIGA